MRGKPSPQKFPCRPSPREGAPRGFRDRLRPSDLTPKLRPAPPRPPRRESARSRVFGRKSSFFAFKAAISGTGVSKKGNPRVGPFPRIPLANGAAGRLRKRRKSAENARGNPATAAERPASSSNPEPESRRFREPETPEEGKRLAHKKKMGADEIGSFRPVSRDLRSPTREMPVFGLSPTFGEEPGSKLKC